MAGLIYMFWERLLFYLNKMSIPSSLTMKMGVQTPFLLSNDKYLPGYTENKPKNSNGRAKLAYFGKKLLLDLNKNVAIICWCRKLKNIMTMLFNCRLFLNSSNAYFFNLCLFQYIMSFDFNMFMLTQHAYFTKLILLNIGMYICSF